MASPLERSLARQQMLGTMAGVSGVPQLAAMGRQMRRQSTAELADLRDPDRPLARSLAQVRLAQGLRDLTTPDSPWKLITDKVHGGTIAVDESDPTRVMRVTAPGVAGAGGTFAGEPRHGLSLPGGGKPREDEQRTAFNLMRITGATQAIANVLGEDMGAEQPGFAEMMARGAGLEEIANAISPEARQRVESAQADILDAALWMSTGAAYNKEQRDALVKAYLPRWSDKPGTLRDKRQRVVNLIRAGWGRAGNATGEQQLEETLAAIDAMYALGSPGGEAAAGIAPGTTYTDPDTGATYVYQGGDPNSESSWRAQ